MEETAPAQTQQPEPAQRADSVTMPPDEIAYADVPQSPSLMFSNSAERLWDDTLEKDAPIFDAGALPSQEGRNLDQESHAQWFTSITGHRIGGGLNLDSLPPELVGSSSHAPNSDSKSPTSICQASLPHHDILPKDDATLSRTETSAKSQSTSPQHNKCSLALDTSTTKKTGDSQLGECTCIQPVVFLVDDLETKRGTTLGVDVGLAALKEALGSAKDLLRCQRCRSKPECITVLTFLSGKLTDLCEMVAAEYWKCVTGRDMARDTEGDHEDRLLPCLVGDYEVDSTREWHAVMETLLRLQLRDVDSLMSRMMGISVSMQLNFACKKLEFAQMRVAVLRHTMGRPL